MELRSKYHGGPRVKRDTRTVRMQDEWHEKDPSTRSLSPQICFLPPFAVGSAILKTDRREPCLAGGPDPCAAPFFCRTRPSGFVQMSHPWRRRETSSYQLVGFLAYLFQSDVLHAFESELRHYGHEKVCRDIHCTYIHTYIHTVPSLLPWTKSLADWP
jgi:hypothetical protein